MMTVDILVVGATGYTGRLITRYLVVHRERESFSLGLAARNASKLSSFVEGLDIPRNAVSTFSVNLKDEAAFEALLRDNKVKVVLNTAGPFLTNSRSVVQACATTGTHYVDINGETPFVKDMIISFDFLATKTGSILVPSAAFDSIPSDLIAYLSARKMSEILSKKGLQATGSDSIGVSESHTMITFVGAGISGGTLNSSFTMIETVPRRVLRELASPDSLSPLKATRTVPRRLTYTFPPYVLSRLPKFKNAIGYLMPLSMHNTSIVQRTRGLFELSRHETFAEDDFEDIKPAYAPDFVYVESFSAGNRFSAVLLALSFVVSMTVLAVVPPLRWLVRKLITQPGDGPKDEVLERGFLHVKNVSLSSPLPGSGKVLMVKSTMNGKGDPGYALSAVMVSECALALLSPREKLPPIARKGGVLTPMAAFGTILMKRLSASGRFDFESEEVEDS